MPLYKLYHAAPGVFIAIWHITEDENTLLHLYKAGGHTGLPPHSDGGASKRWLAARLALQHTLRHGLQYSGSMLINKTAAGKPYLAHSNIHVNLSHSKHYAAAIAGHGSPLGTDIEEPRQNIALLAHKFLQPAELDICLPHGEQALLHVFSAKEAVYKKLGDNQLHIKSNFTVTRLNYSAAGGTCNILAGPQDNKVLYNVNLYAESGFCLSWA